MLIFIPQAKLNAHTTVFTKQPDCSSQTFSNIWHFLMCKCHFDVSLWSLIRRFSPLSPLCLLPLNKRFSFWKCGKATSSSYLSILRTSGIFALNIPVSNACKWSWRCKPSLPSWCEASEWGEGLAVALAKCGFSPDWEERKQAGEKPYHVVMFVSLVKQDIPSQFTC